MGQGITCPMPDDRLQAPERSPSGEGAVPGRPRSVPALEETSSGEDAPAWADIELVELCHDLRSSTATIRALVTALGLEYELPPGAQARLGQVDAEVQRIDEMCSQMMPGRRRTDQLPLTRLDPIAAEVVHQARTTHPRVGLMTAPAVAAIDGLAVRRILSNLIDNGRRAAGVDGELLVRVWSTEREVCLEVADSGPGFGAGPPGAASLGLTIVRALTERHGGRVEVGDSELGGAQVSVTLPTPHIDLTALTANST